MTNKIITPQKLKKGSCIRVIAPSRSMVIISEDCKNIALKRFEELGIKVSFSKHINENNDFCSSSIESRVEDLHEAFLDKNVDAILTAIGGYNSNQMLDYIDYEIIKNNPKIFCGFSDITVLECAIFSQTGLVTYNGPHYSSWGMLYGFDYSKEYFIKSFMEDSDYEIKASKEWSDDPWFMDQEKREFIKNDPYQVINTGRAKGRLIGGHTRCLASLQGTKYWPGLDDSILILEEDEEVNIGVFDRHIQSFIHLPDFSGVKGIIIGRFQKNSNITKEQIEKVIKSKKELNNIPVIANADIGHTTPLATWPIGALVEMNSNPNDVKINILKSSN